MVFSVEMSCFAAVKPIVVRVTTEYSSYKYTGEKIVPKIVVYNNIGKVVSKYDYKVSITNNKNVGTANIKVTGINKYSGVVNKEFKILKANIKNTKIEKFKVYSGKKISLNITYKGIKLKQGKDFTVTSKKINNKTVNVTVKGKGNFTGKRVIKKALFPQKVTGIHTKKTTTDSITLEWKSLKSNGVTNYSIYKCDENGNNIKFIKSVKTNSATIDGFNAGDYAYFVIRGYYKKDGYKYFGEYSNVFKTTSKPQKVKNISISKENKKLTFYWEKAACTGYEVKYSTDKSFKTNVKTVTVEGKSKNSLSVNISNNNTYYSRVRAFRRYKYNGRTVIRYGKWSNRVSSVYSVTYADYTTSYVNNYNRTQNLKIASEYINGTILMPGETFSFNQVVGKRTADKGFLPATVFTGSTSTDEQIGGGICQVASTMFNAVLYANLQIVERHQHSQRVSYVYLGRDAAIYWGSEDFKFKNNTNQAIKIEMKCSDGKITCSLKVNKYSKPDKVKLSVYQDGKNFTLKRYVNGICNYTTKSYY